MTDLITSNGHHQMPEPTVVDSVVDYRAGRASDDVPAQLQWLTSALDVLPTRVMVTDPGYVITYVNQATLDAFEKEKDSLPVAGADLVGLDLHLLEEALLGGQDLLGDPRELPKRAQLKVGDETLELLCTALWGSDGQFLGAMVTWETVTARMRFETSYNSVLSMMENMPVSMVGAGPDGVIHYANPAALASLRSVEPHLPVPVDEVVGSTLCILQGDDNEDFDPSVFTNPARLPFSMRVQIGPETFDMAIEAVRDARGVFTGTVGSWKTITDLARQEAAK